jgi:hypothetical protein
MNTPLRHALLVLLAGVGLLAAHGQAFDSGSTGAYGAINVTTADVTLDVPADGIFHATTVNVAAGRTLRFRANALNTPVYILATGDVTVSGNIRVDGEPGTQTAAGRGGPGGFDGGTPGSVGTPPGDGKGPGAGGAGEPTANQDGAGSGSYATRPGFPSVPRHGGTYGSALLIPLAGGSGGGGTTGTPGTGGGGGGGAILIASNTRITVNVSAGIFALGGYTVSGGAYHSGSGGAIRLVAPEIAGNGTLNASGGAGFFDAGDGRIRVDTLNRSQLAFNFQPPGITAIGSLMLVFPSPLPRLDITAAAGTAIAVDSGPVLVTLPFGSPATQQVKVRAQDFGQVVPVRVVLTPDSGDTRTYDVEINNAAANPAEATVDVELPVNTRTAIAVWTR